MSRKGKSGSSKLSSGTKSDRASTYVESGKYIRTHSALVLSVFAILFALVAMTAAIQKSPTVDEPVHLFSGYSYLKWRDFRPNPEHPPLVKLWAALPLLLLDLKDSRPSSTRWDLIAQTSPNALNTVAVAAKMIFVDNDADWLFFWARAQMIILAIVLGIFIYRWSAELFGGTAAIAALFFYGLDPNILAHSPIVQTDIPFTTMFFIGTYYYWRALGKFTWPNVALASLFFGLVAITKYTYAAVFLVWGILGILKIFSAQSQAIDVPGIRGEIKHRWGKAALLGGMLACALMAAYLCIWFAYGFRFDAVPGGVLHLPIAEELVTLPHLRGTVSFLVRYHLFPEAWIYGQLYVLNNLQREAYLLGAYSDHGFWLYFPVAFAVKTPVPTLLLLLATFGLWLSKGKERFVGLPLLTAAGVYFCLAIWSHLNIGVRHILPIYPFLFVLIGGTAAALWESHVWFKRVPLIFLSLWYLWSATSIYPHYLAFFNELAGGPANGHKVLLDSNLDWGQDLKGLKHWLDANGVKKIQFLYFGFHDVAEPRYYGIDAQYLPGSWVDPEFATPGDSALPDYLALSAHLLFGNFLRGQQRNDFVKPFRSLKPTATIGYSILIFRMSDMIKKLRNVAETNPGSASAQADLGSLLENQGYTAEAVNHYQHAIKLDPRSTKARYSLGIILAREGKLDESITNLRAAAEASPRDADVHYDFALVLAMNSNVKEAVQQFQKTISLDPTYTKAHYNLATLLITKGEVDQAVEQLWETVNIDPLYAKARFQLGTLLADQGKIDEAIHQLGWALQIDPNMAEAHESLGRVLERQGKRKEAIRHYEEALRIIKSRNGRAVFH